MLANLNKRVDAAETQREILSVLQFIIAEDNDKSE